MIFRLGNARNGCESKIVALLRKIACFSSIEVGFKVKYAANLPWMKTSRKVSQICVEIKCQYPYSMTANSSCWHECEIVLQVTKQRFRIHVFRMNKKLEDSHIPNCNDNSNSFPYKIRMSIYWIKRYFSRYCSSILVLRSRESESVECFRKIRFCGHAASFHACPHTRILWKYSTIARKIPINSVLRGLEGSVRRTHQSDLSIPLEYPPNIDWTGESATAELIVNQRGHEA